MVDAITDFLVEFGYFEDSRERLKEVVAKHIEYQTLIVVRGNNSNNDIIVVVTWDNVPPDTLYVHDMVVHPNYRHKGLVRQVINYGLKLNPWAKNLLWERKLKNKPLKSHKVKE